jgi:hypothetical protein
MVPRGTHKEELEGPPDFDAGVQTTVAHLQAAHRRNDLTALSLKRLVLRWRFRMDEVA